MISKCLAFHPKHAVRHSYSPLWPAPRGGTHYDQQKRECLFWINHGHGLKPLVLLISASEKRSASNGGWLTYQPTKEFLTLIVAVNEESWKHALTRHQHGSRIYAQDQLFFCRFRRAVTLTLTPRQILGSRTRRLPWSVGIVRLLLAPDADLFSCKSQVAGM